MLGAALGGSGLGSALRSVLGTHVADVDDVLLDGVVGVAVELAGVDGVDVVHAVAHGVFLNHLETHGC